MLSFYKRQMSRSRRRALQARLGQEVTEAVEEMFLEWFDLYVLNDQYSLIDPLDAWE